MRFFASPHGRMVGPLPCDHVRSVSQKAHSSRAASCSIEWSACFRLRFVNGRFAPAPFQSPLRLRYTFPFAKPQAEAKSRQD